MYSPEEIRREGLDDFRVFLAHVWEHLKLPPPTRVQYDIADYLQHGPRRQIIEAFRGVGKSWITVAFVLWTLFLDPQKNIMVVSASQNLADNFSKFCKQLIHGMPLLQHLAPRDGQRDSGIEFDVGPAGASKDPSVKSVGITGQLTGSRADLIVADDVEVPKNSYTPILRDRLADLVKEFDALLKSKELNPRVVYLGTPQIESSLYNRLYRERGYSIRIWPAEIPASVSAYNGNLAPFIHKLIAKGARPGDPVDPQRFTTEDLKERLASYARAGYALQYMLDTSPADAEKYPLKLKDLIIWDCDDEMAPAKFVWGDKPEAIIRDLDAGGFDGDHYRRPVFHSPEHARYANTIMAIDPSGKGKDETAYAVLRFLHGYLFLVDIGGFVDGFGEETLETLAGKAARWQVGDILIEKNYGGGMFDQLLKPYLSRVGHGRVVDDDEWNGWSSTQKEMRILDTLQPIVENHKLIVDRRVIQRDLEVQRGEAPRYSFIQQFTRMCRLKGALPNEDRLEALSMACSFFMERMSRDADKELSRHKQSLIDRELKNFHKHVFGRPTGTSWGPRGRP